jgi:hypothetical protein
VPSQKRRIRKPFALHADLATYSVLQGRFQAALGASAEGQSRDRECNPVQASRLARYERLSNELKR